MFYFHATQSTGHSRFALGIRLLGAHEYRIDQWFPLVEYVRRTDHPFPLNRVTRHTRTHPVALDPSRVSRLARHAVQLGRNQEATVLSSVSAWLSTEGLSASSIQAWSADLEVAIADFDTTFESRPSYQALRLLEPMF
jgi:hypothetical protein